MKRSDPVRLLSLATLAALAACSGGGGSTGSGRPAGDFVAVRTNPDNGQTIYLNDPIRIDFSNPVDLDTASLTTLTFQALDQQGVPVSELVTGSFSLGRSEGDLEVGRQLLFVPTFATDNFYLNGGFRPGRTYLAQLVGGSSATTVLRDRNGRALAQPMTFRFTTRDGTQPAQLYRNPLPGGPKRTGFEISTASDLDNVPLGLFGEPPLEVRLHFDQALNPNDVNVPVNVVTDPLTRDETERGRVFLEYKDPVLDPGLEEYTWIPADAEIERNDLTGATLVLRPLGVMPNNATVRVVVEAELEDISGESNLDNPAYNRIFAEFKTASAYGQQWDAIVEEFDAIGNIDLAAAFPEAQAEVGPGYIKAGFEFEGKSTSRDYAPNTNEVVLNTAFTQITPADGLPFTVSGGVFDFRNVTIPQGVTVRGQGPNPMVWLCNGTFTVGGTLSVRGGNGARVDTLNSANFAKAGGVGVTGGGNGGDGTPSATLRDLRGGTGRGPLQEAGKGGRGGYLAYQSGCYTGSGYNGSGGGSGGGGGTLATQGDPHYRGTAPTTINPNTPPTANTAFQQKLGYGGAGCSGGSGTRTQFLLGGEPGDRVFVDNRADNNFWGSGINLAGPGGRTIRISGELPVPVGGGGGGGGGDTSWAFSNSLTGNDPKNDYSGGGGGGGGGVLIVKALGEITILASGKIVADGGHGGGGEQVGASGEAGGGGGGAGGMVVLMSAKKIVIEAHGNTSVNPARLVYGLPPGATAGSPNFPYADKDYSFAISADGGVCLTGGFGSVNITGKYPQPNQVPLAGSQYDADPLGGFGGMGIVQLMAPPGDNSADNTNTVLDDNIVFRLPGSSVDLVGPAKRQLLAWRGFPDAAGVFRADNGSVIDIGSGEGDIRPAPTLLPCPFSARSRARSRWIDTGLTQRRPLTAEDGQPRGIVLTGGAVVGPVFEFAGTQTSGSTAGYVDYTRVGSGVRIDYPDAPGLSALPIASTSTDATYLGQPAYRVTLAAPALGEANRYSQYEAEMLNAAGSVLAGFRILRHNASELLLDPGTDLMPAEATQLRVRAKFFEIVTRGAEGLGTTRTPVISGVPDPDPVPISNVRIGFAFHQDPDPANILNGRFPSSNENDFLFDLQDPAFLAWLATNGPPRYVQWDVMFDMAYKHTDGSEPDGLRPNTPRPELHWLRLPFRF